MLKKSVTLFVITAFSCCLLNAHPILDPPCKKYEKGVILYSIARDNFQWAKNYEQSKSNLLSELGKDSVPSSIYFQLAVNYACLHNQDSMFYFLNKYVEYSEDDRVIFIDSVFIPYASTPEWARLVNSIENAYLQALPTTVNSKYALAIFYLSIERFKVRNLFLQEHIATDSPYLQMNKIDAAIDLINQYGFPTINSAGKFGVRTMYEMLEKRYISNRMYRQYKRDYSNNKLASTIYAILTDQWLMQHNRRQKYGTQICPILDWNNMTIIKYSLCCSQRKADKLYEAHQKMGFSEPVSTYIEIMNETIAYMEYSIVKYRKNVR